MPQPRYRKGDRIGGRYLVHQALMGGMGEVYLCLDLEENAPYALKTFQARYMANPHIRQLFAHEVGTWVALEKHPNIVRCFYMDTLDNQPFMVLEWVAAEEGRRTDLRSWLRRGPLDLRLALDFIIDICRGLIHAQAKQPGIVHRDLKPDNILVSQERQAKITDFGLATLVQQAGLELAPEASTGTGQQTMVGASGIVGTPPYMAPEQWRGEPADARADLYAIGCILHELLTGAPPFTARTIDDLRRLHLEAPSPTLATYNMWLACLDGVLSHCLAKRRDERFATSDELLHVLAPIYQQHFGAPPRIIAFNGEFTAEDYNNRGITYDKLQHYEQALADYARAIELNPTYAAAYTNRGATYKTLGHYEEAFADHTRAIELDATFAGAYVNRGITYNSLQRYEEALADYTHAIQLDSSLVPAHYNRANTYDTLERYDEALADYTSSIQLDPSLVQAYTNRGATYELMGQYNKALADFSQAIQLDPSSAQAYINRAAIYNELQCDREALADFTDAIHRDLDNPQTYLERGFIYARIEQYDAALADFTRTLCLSPENVEACFSAGSLLMLRGAWLEALPYFEKGEQRGHAKSAEYATLTRRKLELPKSNTP
jgi:serine/threonine protein kinase